jgi:hypothetical protein
MVRIRIYGLKRPINYGSTGSGSTTLHDGVLKSLHQDQDPKELVTGKRNRYYLKNPDPSVMFY